MLFINLYEMNRTRRWHSRLERFPRMRKVRCSNPSCDGPNSLKQVVTVPQLNARQQVWVSWVLGDEHYKRMNRVTASVARERILTAQWPWLPSIDQNLQPFTSNGDVSICVKKSWVGGKSPNKQIKSYTWKQNKVLYFTYIPNYNLCRMVYKNTYLGNASRLGETWSYILNRFTHLLTSHFKETPVKTMYSNWPLLSL